MRSAVWFEGPELDPFLHRAWLKTVMSPGEALHEGVA